MVTSTPVTIISPSIAGDPNFYSRRRVLNLSHKPISHLPLPERLLREGPLLLRWYTNVGVSG